VKRREFITLLGGTVAWPVAARAQQSTILDAVGEDPFGWTSLAGRSLFELGSAPFDSERTVFSEYHAFGSPTASFMVRNGRWKYNYYVGFPPELFDLADDPLEEHNLAGDPAYRAHLACMDARLRAMIDPETTDLRAKSDQAALIARYGGPAKAMNVGAPSATPAPL
jgi:choline-sulfatase